MTDLNLAPETHNSEQDDHGSQAQQIAEQAKQHRHAVAGATESRKPHYHEPIPVDEQDVIDHMRDMESSGRIDMDAYAGEPNHDDNTGKYGPGHDPEGRNPEELPDSSI